MMTISVGDGELRLPMLLLIPLVAAVAALYSLALYHTIHESPGARLCHIPYHLLHSRQESENRTHPAHTPTRPVDAPPASHHPGCTADPVYTSRDACPTCFLRTVTDVFPEERFTATPHHVYLAPRGPRNFFYPHAAPRQDVTRHVLLEPRDVCSEAGACPYLVAVVMSMMHERGTREDIRRTWASVATMQHWPAGAALHARVHVVFVIAWSLFGDNGRLLPADKLDEKEREYRLGLITEEANVHNDILMLEMMDSYSNLTLKVASALSWALVHCRRTKFFLKIDQDTFVNMPLLLDLLIYHETRLTHAVTGHIYNETRRVERVGRWGVNKARYPVAQYPVFASGCAYILSRQATDHVMTLFRYFPPMGIEDVFLTGILGRAAGIHHFSPNVRNHFTEFFHTITNWCDFLTDKLVTGTNLDSNARRMNLWAGHILNDWHCSHSDFTDLNAKCTSEFPQRLQRSGILQD